MGTSSPDGDPPISADLPPTLDAAMDIDLPPLYATLTLPSSSTNSTSDASSPPTDPSSTPDALLVTPNTPSSQSTTSASPFSTPGNKTHPPLVPSGLGEITGRTIHNHLENGLGIRTEVDDDALQTPPTPKTYGRKRSRSILSPFTPASINDADDEETPPRLVQRHNDAAVPKTPRVAPSARLARRRALDRPRFRTTTSSNSPSSPHRKEPSHKRPYLELRRGPMPDCCYRPPRSKLVVSAMERTVKVKKGERIKAGETIMRSPLLYTALNTSALSSHCAGCLLDPETKFRRGQEKCLRTVQEGFLQCSRCRKVQYCSLACCAKNQMAHWPECRALSRCEQVPSVEVRLLAKMIFARATSKVPLLPVYSLPEIVDSSMRQELLRVVEKVIVFLSKVHGSEGLFPWSEYNFTGADDAADFIRQARTMIMPLSDHEERPVGLCVADLPSSIRHSCRPNAYVAFPEGLTLSDPLRVVSLKERCATEDKEEEITISYVDLAVPRHQRDALLIKQGFCHDCAECQTGHNRPDERWAMMHDGCKGEVDKGLLSLNGQAPTIA